MTFLDRRTSFVVWTTPTGTTSLDIVSDDEALWGDYAASVAMATRFPADMTLQMDEGDDDDTPLTDSLPNLDDFIVASRRLASFLIEAGVSHVELLPVAILDRAGARVAADYTLVHPIDPIACLDIERSGARWSRDHTGGIRSVERLVIDADAVPSDRLMFSPRDLGEVVLVRRELAEAIDARGFTNVAWTEPSDYR